LRWYFGIEDAAAPPHEGGVTDRKPLLVVLPRFSLPRLPHNNMLIREGMTRFPSLNNGLPTPVSIAEELLIQEVVVLFASGGRATVFNAQG